MYIGDADNYLHALDASTLAVNWTIGLGNAVVSSPSVSSDGTVYVGAGNNLYAINSADGSTKWLYKAGSAVQSSPAIAADGTIYFGSNDRSLYALGSGGLVGLSTSANAVVGGSPILGTATFAVNAGSPGDLVSLSVNSSLGLVPASVKVQPDTNKATFSVSTAPVSMISYVRVTASCNGQTLQTTVELLPAALSALRLTTASILGGTSEKGAVYLNGVAGPSGTTITLASDSTNAAVPASVSIPSRSNAINFTINTLAVSTSTPVTLTASDGVHPTLQSTLTVVPATVSALTATPATVIGGLNSSVTLTLNGKAGPSGNIVNLLSNNAAATVPTSVKVLAGTGSASFTVTTNPIPSNIAVTITATSSGVSKSGILNVNAPSLSLLRLTSATLKGGTGMNVAVYLTGVAPIGGVIVNLSSSSQEVKLPASVVVPAGQSAFAFPVTTSKVSASTQVTLTAKLGAVTLTRTLTVTP